MNKPFQFISHLFDSVFEEKKKKRFQNLNGLIIEREQSSFFFFVFWALTALFFSSSFLCVFEVELVFNKLSLKEYFLELVN